MTIEEGIYQLTVSRMKLRQVINQAMDRRDWMSQEENQQFLFDLRDYSDSLLLVTERVEEQFDMDEVTTISQHLSEQHQLLQRLVKLFTESLEQEEAMDGQQAGDIRRTIASIQGMLELNTMMLQENLSFQRKIKEFPSKAPESKPTSEKKLGFFDRLFKGK